MLLQFVLNSDFRVYECLQNGTDPDNPNGKPSLDEPTFTDLEPRSAGSSGDGYIWKYLYTIKPADIVKFESTDFLPVPQEWASSTDVASVRNNAVDGSIKIVTVTNRGVAIGRPTRLLRPSTTVFLPEVEIPLRLSICNTPKGVQEINLG